MTNQKTALITGIHGQDGYYLSRLLLEKGYRVTGVGRVTRGPNWSHTSDIDYRSADLNDLSHLIRLFKEQRPSEVYNLAAQSFVPFSWEQPIGTFEANGLPVVSLLEAIRATDPEIRFFQASSAQMFGQHSEQPCTEQTPFRPQNPYAASKLFAHMITVDYREGQGLFASCGILFNHESPLRPPCFVSRKITSTVARIKQGKQDNLKLGNLDAERDWGYAGDYVRGMWLSLQADEPSDYVFCTGKTFTVGDFLRLAFEVVGLDWRDHVESDGRLSRRGERDVLVGSSRKAHEELGWRLEVEFADLVEMMVRSEMKRPLESQPWGLSAADTGSAMEHEP